MTCAAPLALALLSACGGGDAGSSTSDGPHMSAAAVATGTDTVTGMNKTGGRTAGPSSAGSQGNALARQGQAVATATKTYYVKNGGNNNSDGLSDATAWQTVGKLNSVKLAAGDSIALQCGSTWHESLNLTASNLVAGSVIGSYGACAADGSNKPRITGADAVTVWNPDPVSGGYVHTFSAPFPTKILRVFIGLPANGVAGEVPLHVAQWPKASGNATTFAEAETSTSTTTAIALKNPTDKSYLDAAGHSPVGATVQVRSQAWDIENTTVTNYAAGVLAVNATQYPAAAGTDQGGFVLQGLRWMLTDAGEFYYDASNHQLYVKLPAQFAGTDPSNLVIEASVRDTPLTIGGVSGLSIQNINADMGNSYGMNINNAPNAVLDHVTASHSVLAGIKIPTSVSGTTDSNVRVTHAIIADNYDMGVDAQSANRVTVDNSTVTDTGMLGYLGISHGALFLGNAGSVSTNDIERSAYAGIRYLGGVDPHTPSNGVAYIFDNDIRDYCLRLQDGGGIYTWNGADKESGQSSWGANQASMVKNNRIISSAPIVGTYPVAGIYLDEHTTAATLDGNFISGGPDGIFVQNAPNNIIRNNKLLLNTRTSLWMQERNGFTDTPAPPHTINETHTLQGNTTTGNTLMPANQATTSTITGTSLLEPKFTTAYALRYSTEEPSLAELTATSPGSSSTNYFASNTFGQRQAGSAPLVATTTSITVTPSVSKTYTYNQWRAVVNQDALLTSPTFKLVKWCPIKSAAYPNGEIIKNGGFETWSSTTPPDNWTLYQAAGTTASVARGCTSASYCARFSVTSDKDLLYSDTWTFSSNTLYLARFSATLGNVTTVVPPYFTVLDGTQIGTANITSISKFDGAAGDSLNTESFFTAPAVASAKINLKVFDTNTVSFDNVSVQAVSSFSPVATSEWSTTVAVPSNGTAATVNCTTLGWGSSCTVADDLGNAVTLPLTVNPGSAKFLVWTNSTAALNAATTCPP